MTETREPTLDEQLHELAAPIRERLKKVESDLRTAQALVTGLREDRSKIRSALRAVDPTFEPDTKPGPKRNGSKPKPYSEHAVEQAVEAIGEMRESLGGREFTAAEIAREQPWPFSSSYTAVLFSVLHDRGVLRLVKRGKGGSKIYAVV